MSEFVFGVLIGGFFTFCACALGVGFFLVKDDGRLDFHRKLRGKK